MLFKIRSVAFFVMVAGLVMLTSPAVTDPGYVRNAALQKVTLQLKWRHQFQFAGYYAAIEKGFYRDAGLDVNIMEARVSEEPSAAVVSGKAEFGIAGTDLLLLRAKGEPVVALAAIYQHSPMVFITPESSGIENIHQLAGKRVMLESHSAELLAYLNAEGLQSSELQLMPHSFGVSELMAGHTDVISAYLTDEPFSLKENGIAYRLFIPQSSGIDFYGDVLFTSEDQITNYPERVKAFVHATREGWKYALNNTEEIVDLILSRYSQRHSREHLLFEAAKSRPLIIPEVVEVGYMNKGRWQHILEKYREQKMIVEDINLDTFIYRPDALRDGVIRQAVQLAEIFFALVALGLVIKVIRSYTSLEELERKNRQVNRKLAKSRRRYSLLLSNMPGMAYKRLFDDQWSMLFVSKGALILTGYSPEQLMNNRATAYASLIHRDDRALVCKQVSEARMRKKPFKLTYRIITADGSEKWVWEQGRFSGSLHAGFPVIEGFIADVSEAKAMENSHQKVIADLQHAIGEIKVLRGILPICASCKQIRDDKGVWNHLEAYIREHTDTEFSHGLCPDCAHKLFPEVYDDAQASKPGQTRQSD